MSLNIARAPGPTLNHRLDWVNGHPVSQLFGDPFYSSKDGRGESEHVFLAGNGLPERWAGR